jgi:hypothetical protein
MMKLDVELVSVLKNFAQINNSLYIRKDSDTVATVSSAKNILAKYTHSQTFPVDVCIYDLTKFINVVNSYELFDLDFNERYVEVVGMFNGKTERTKIFFADPEIIVKPSKEITMPAVSVSFTLTKDTIDRIKKIAATLGVSDISFTTNNNELVVQIMDDKNSSSNSHTIIVGDYPTDKTFDYRFSVDNLKLLTGDYVVSLTDKIISQFTHTTSQLNYWIAMTNKSKAIVETPKLRSAQSAIKANEDEEEVESELE